MWPKMAMRKNIERGCQGTQIRPQFRHLAVPFLFHGRDSLCWLQSPGNFIPQSLYFITKRRRRIGELVPPIPTPLFLRLFHRAQALENFTLYVTSFLFLLNIDGGFFWCRRATDRTRRDSLGPYFLLALL